MSGAIVAAALVVANAGCDRGDPTGSAAQPATVAYCILNVHTDDATVHFEGPDSLLAAGEGAAPLVIDVRVMDFIIPVMTTTGNLKPDASAVSDALGFTLTERLGVDDFTRVTVTGFQRVEAYPDFQRTVFEVRDAACKVTLGTGAVFRPIGVYWKVVNATDVTLPDVGVEALVPVPDPLPAPPPPSPPPPPADAGQAPAARDGGP